MEKQKFVKKTDNISEVIGKFPESAEVFLAYGLHCVGCFANVFDTVEAGAEIHGMSEEELNDMLKEVNYIIGENKKAKSKNENDEKK